MGFEGRNKSVLFTLKKANLSVFFCFPLGPIVIGFCKLNNSWDVVVVVDPRNLYSWFKIGWVTPETLLIFSFCGGGESNPSFVRLGWLGLWLSWGCDNRIYFCQGIYLSGVWPREKLGPPFALGISFVKFWRFILMPLMNNLEFLAQIIQEHQNIIWHLSILLTWIVLDNDF